jgi:phage terminase large subunit GpA-like protein
MSELWRERFERQQRERLADAFDNLTAELVIKRPSEWAESKRYLPPSVTSLPGLYSFNVAPYVREILDCLAADSPIREVTWMKGVQICATTGVLENAIGYYIDEIRHSPIMLVTADDALAKLRMESYVTPMLHHSELAHLIKSSDEKNTRKTGKTEKRIEWEGGGFLIPFGAQSANKLRSISIEVLLRDEIDGWPDVVGKDGDPIKLSADRTAAFEASRKILDISTPLVKGQSKIEQRFRRGDQRYYFVRCLKCNFAQTLRWRHQNNETGEVTGISWELDNGRLVPDSVRYLCQECGHPHTNDDKTRLLSPEHGAEWIPTAEPADPYHRSYHLSALYSPVGMQTWAACVHKWLDAWDVERNRAKDLGQLQVFYNNVLGEPFELRGEKLRFENVSAHRRSYYSGTIPNQFAAQFCGSPVLLLTCAVDVQKHCLAVAVFGWCKDRRAILVDYWRFEGETEKLEDLHTWGKLRKLIESREYTADDGKKYRIMLTLIDSGFRADDVYRFAEEYVAGVYPVKGRDDSTRNARDREFSDFKTPMGTMAYGIFVGFYKDRWSAALRRSWDGLGLQPQGHFNAPVDTTDKQLKELTVEVKREKIEKTTGKRLGFEWHRPGGADNELWDLIVYNNAALDLVAHDVCIRQQEMAFVNWVYFYERCSEGLFFS